MHRNGGIGEWTGNRGWPRRSCIRTENYRLEKNVLLDGRRPGPDDEDVYLVDVRKDPREFTNLAVDPDYAEFVLELSARLDEHTEEMVEIPRECLVR